jgi:hypothetical protein
MSNDVQRRCVVCGKLLKQKSREYLIENGFGVRRGDGSVLWHCKNHAPIEILAAMDGVPKFNTAKLEEKNDRL